MELCTLIEKLLSPVNWSEVKYNLLKISGSKDLVLLVTDTELMRDEVHSLTEVVDWTLNYTIEVVDKVENLIAEVREDALRNRKRKRKDVEK